MSDTEVDPFLLKQYEELNAFVRHGLQLLAGWYTFFITANVVATGWFIGTESRIMEISVPSIFVWAGFMFVNLLALSLCGRAMSGFRTAKRVAVEFQSLLLSDPHDAPAEESDTTHPRDVSGQAISVYIKIVHLMRLSFFGVMAVWTAILVGSIVL